MSKLVWQSRIALGSGGGERDEGHLQVCDGRFESRNRRRVWGRRILQLRELGHLQRERVGGRTHLVVLRPANLVTLERDANARRTACRAGCLAGRVRNLLLRALPDRRRLSGD